MWSAPRIAVLTSIVLVSTFSFAAPQKGSDPGPHPLLTARAAHDLPLQEAARAYPVHIRGVVTFYDPYIDSRHGALFVHDATGCIFLGVPLRPILPIKPGTLVDIQGVTGTGDFAPVVADAKITVLEQSELPAAATPVSLNQLQEGQFDGQWVEMEGMVRAVRYQPHDVVLEIMTLAGPVDAITPRVEAEDYDRLVDAQIRIHANAAPVTNGRNQLVGAHLFFPTLDQVKVLNEPPVDPFVLPPVKIADLLKFQVGSGGRHRVHVQAVVTLRWPGSLLCIQQGGDGLCMQSRQTDPVQAGDTVDIIGFPDAADFKSTLDNPTYRVSGSAPFTKSKPIKAEQAFAPSSDRQLVTTEGVLMAQAVNGDQPALMLRSGKYLFAAILPREAAVPGKLPWKEGTLLRVTGVSSAQFNPRGSLEAESIARLQSASILLRGIDDVTVLRAPSWWTPERALTGVAGFALAAIGAFTWVVVLRRRVEYQTRELRRREERLRHMSQHDILTGLPNRALLNDRLAMALKRIERFPGFLGVLMIDLDMFKEVNDSLGHPAGDHVLCETARRISSSVRKTDTVARLGGDEFVVLLPDLRRREEAEIVAAKLVIAISKPIEGLPSVVNISASVGVCTSESGESSADHLLQRADAAMYRAKAQGKDSYYVSESQHTTS